MSVAPRRLGLIVPWALFAALVLGWIVYWHIVAGQAEQRLRAWAQAETQDGGHAAVGRIVRHGFPVLMRLELQDVAYAPARGGWRLQTDRADLNIDMLNPSHVILAAEAPIQIIRSESVSTLEANALIASLQMNGERLVLAGVEADELTLDDPAKEGLLRVVKLVANVRPDPRAPGDYQTAFEATGVTLPRPVRSFEGFGQDVALIRAAMVITHGADLLQSAPADPLAPWRHAGGRVRFEALALNWGPLEATGSGEGGVDETRRLQGHLALPIERPGAIFSALANGPDVDADARRALALFAAGYAISGDGIMLDVEAQDGVLRLEGLSVRLLPPVY